MSVADVLIATGIVLIVPALAAAAAGWISKRK
jgi:hypothetical protein